MNASQSGTFKVGGDIEVNRLGFGAMRITGQGIWGEPSDRGACLETLRACAPSASISSTPPTPTAPTSPSN